MKEEMTANEMADKLKLFWHTENDNLFEEASTMLRQQQAEIEALKLRKLTDEEIGHFKGQWYRGDFNSFYDLVKSITKKASEG